MRFAGTEEAGILGARAGRARAGRRGRGRAHRGAVRGGRDRPARRGGLVCGGDRGLLPHERAQSRVLEDVLVRQQIPYQVIGGPRFYERAEIKDAMAYLSVLDNPSDAVSLLRIANRPRRAIGDTSLQRLVTHAEALGLTLFQAMADPEAAGLGTAAIKAVRGFHTMMQSLQSAAQELEVDELLEAVLARSGTLEALEAERTIEARGRIENLEELVGVAREFRAEREEPTLSAFLQEISLVSDQDGLAAEESLVTLMTIHNAKGLEFRAVFLIGMEEALPALPLDRGQPRSRRSGGSPTSG